MHILVSAEKIPAQARGLSQINMMFVFWFRSYKVGWFENFSVRDVDNRNM